MRLFALLVAACCLVLTELAALQPGSASALNAGCSYLYEIGEPSETCKSERAREIAQECSYQVEHGIALSPQCVRWQEAESAQRMQEADAASLQAREAAASEMRLREYEAKVPHRLDVWLFSGKLGYLRQPGFTSVVVDAPESWRIELIVKRYSHTVLRMVLHTELPNSEVEGPYGETPRNESPHASASVDWTCKYPGSTYSYSLVAITPTGEQAGNPPGYRSQSVRLKRSGHFKGASRYWCAQLRRKDH